MCLAAWGRARTEEQRLNDLARLGRVPDLPLVAAGATEPTRDHEVDGEGHLARSGFPVGN